MMSEPCSETTLGTAERAPHQPLPAGGAGPAAAAPEFVIDAGPRWAVLDWRELWRYRELLFLLAWRDVKVRYKQTLLGAAWAVLQPTLMMIVFTLFLGRLAKVGSGDLPYPVFVYAGLLPWTFFATAISSAGNSVVESERLVTKVYFPRLAIPFAAAGAALVDFLVASGVLAVLMIAYGLAPGWGLALVPGLVALLALAALGAGTLLAALNVAYRDVRYVLPFLVQLWMFATPAIYLQPGDGEAGAPGWAQPLMGLNPMAGLVASFRAAVLGGPLPWGQLGVSAAAAAALFVAGCLYFRRTEDSFADVI
jgi:lipopolysaccharide transport system permease protein